ncbi:acetyl-CoA synthetase-like protein [Laetiporus sulphureus 93-53]|uniref:Acetyl-CoA synthetase-like protein n=1 Tax=Laetiporus sulphureus 93-53 TaxID=1314785 RepID=A0A165HPJ6_9APHY|nr:acetyl-CoA synthetase-like protein [Laetiporus sulphureus 93-53]KZT12012.1 acetyl-CoA synthetase-like protein [Laetiporus sulphureus 93-53]
MFPPSHYLQGDSEMARIIRSPFKPVPPLPEQNVHDFLFNHPDNQPAKDYTVHVDGLTGRKVSRHEFVERVRDAATALGTPTIEGGLGIGEKDGEIVGIFSHNALDFPVLVNALLVITTPFALLSAYSTPFELAQSLRTSKATRLFVQSDLLSIALQAAKEVGLPEDRIYILHGHVKGKETLDDLIQHARQQRLLRVQVKPVKKDTLAYLVFSSGTTGRSKAVMISHGNICYSLVQNDISFKEDGSPRPPSPLIWLGFLPMYHTYGLHLFCFRGFWVPSTIVIIPKWDLVTVVKLIPKLRINVLWMTPSAVHQLAHSKDWRKEDFASVLTVGAGAAYLPLSLAKHMKERLGENKDVTQGYGMSEMTISSTRMPTPNMFGGRIPPMADSVGVLLPGQDARIVREDGSDADVNEPGELWMRGGNVALGYWQDEEATRRTFLKDGWLRSGDQFRVDELGRLFFMERVKDTLKVSGFQVSPTEIEDVLMAHPEKLLVEACVAGVSSGRSSDEKVPRAWVVLSDEGKAQGERTVVAKLDEQVRKNLSRYKWLRGGIEVVGEIPKLPTGKVLRRALQSQHEERQKVSAKL